MTFPFPFPQGREDKIYIRKKVPFSFLLLTWGRTGCACVTWRRFAVPLPLPCQIEPDRRRRRSVLFFGSVFAEMYVLGGSNSFSIPSNCLESLKNRFFKGKCGTFVDQFFGCPMLEQLEKKAMPIETVQLAKSLPCTQFAK